MQFLVVMTLIFLQISAFGQDVKHPEGFHMPFWKSKPDVQKKMLKDDLIVVSAETKQIQDKPVLHLMKVVAGGISNTPFDFTYSIITDYGKLKDVDSHFKESKYDKEKKTLYLHMEALGYHARMHLKLSEVEIPVKGSSQNRIKQIHWECYKGTFQGMKGLFQIEEIERQKTEISMTADYRSETLPLPKVLMGLGLEIVGRQVAQKMRQYIVDQYKNK